MPATQEVVILDSDEEEDEPTSPQWSEDQSNEESAEGQGEELEEEEVTEGQDSVSSISIQGDEEWLRVKEHVQAVIDQVSHRPRFRGVKKVSAVADDAAWQLIELVGGALRRGVTHSTPTPLPPVEILQAPPACSNDVSVHLASIATSLTNLCRAAPHEEEVPAAAPVPLPPRPAVSLPSEALALLQRLSTVAEAGLGAVGKALGAKRARASSPSPDEGAPPKTKLKLESEEDEGVLRAMSAEVKQLLASEGVRSIAELRHKMATTRQNCAKLTQSEMQRAQHVASLQRDVLLRDVTIVQLQSNSPSSAACGPEHEKITAELDRIRQTLTTMKQESVGAKGAQSRALLPTPSVAPRSTEGAALGGAAVLVRSLQDRLTQSEVVIATQAKAIQSLEEQVKRHQEAARATSALPQGDVQWQTLQLALKKQHETQLRFLAEAVGVLLARHVSWVVRDEEVEFTMCPLPKGTTPSTTAVHLARETLALLDTDTTPTPAAAAEVQRQEASVEEVGAEKEPATVPAITLASVAVKAEPVVVQPTPQAATVVAEEPLLPTPHETPEVQQQETVIVAAPMPEAKEATSVLAQEEAEPASEMQATEPCVLETPAPSAVEEQPVDAVPTAVAEVEEPLPAAEEVVEAPSTAVTPAPAEVPLPATPQEPTDTTRSSLFADDGFWGEEEEDEEGDGQEE